jgi:hypothetical protein
LGLYQDNLSGTAAFTERFWKCHRCNEGGDVFTLVRTVKRCDFPAALRLVAALPWTMAAPPNIAGCEGVIEL